MSQSAAGTTRIMVASNSEPSDAANSSDKEAPANEQHYTQASSRPTPDGGVRKILYWINAHVLRHPDWIPRLSKRQLRKLEALAANEQLRTLSGSFGVGSFAFLNATDATEATTCAVTIASVTGWITQKVGVVLDGRPAHGICAVRLGIEGTMTVRQLIQRVEELQNFRSFITKLPTSKFFVRCIGSDPIAAGKNPSLDSAKLQDVISFVQSNCEYLFIDIPNDGMEETTHRLIEPADVLVFVASAADHDSLRQLAILIDTLQKRDLERQVEQAVVLISNIPKGESIESYRHYLKQCIFDGPIVGIPYDPDIARDQIVQIGNYREETQQAYRKAAIAMFEQLAKYRQETDHTT